MEVDKIEEIIRLLKKYDLNKIYIEIDSFKLEIHHRENADRDFENIKCTKNKDEIFNDKKQLCNKREEYIIRSPLVGTISILENKETGKKYSVGDTVEIGEVMCIIEAMKMFNDIVCNKHGVITEILITDNEFVEYDQPLFRICEAGGQNV